MMSVERWFNSRCIWCAWSIPLSLGGVIPFGSREMLVDKGGRSVAVIDTVELMLDANRNIRLIKFLTSAPGLRA